jgi:hypothetical protein
MDKLSRVSVDLGFLPVHAQQITQFDPMGVQYRLQSRAAAPPIGNVVPVRFFPFTGKKPFQAFHEGLDAFYEIIR